MTPGFDDPILLSFSQLQNPLWIKPPFKYGTIPNTSTESNIFKNNRNMYHYMQKHNQHSVEEAIVSLKAE